jgi:hypothetical protein
LNWPLTAISRPLGALRQAGNDTGEILTTCISLFNPEINSIGGRLATAG